MGKFSFKRPRIISKKFPELDSSVDRVKQSLENLIFSYQKNVDETLQKKHGLMIASSLVLLVVFGYFVSPEGKAESATFYPSTCLGGWVNPHYAEGPIETTSNGDAAQFNKHNSAVLPKNTDAEMYCGGFKGTFDPATKPTKIIVSLALTKGEELLLEDRIESGSFASSSGAILDSASSTEVSFTLILASTTASTTTTHASPSQEGHIDTSIATPVTIKEEGASLMNGIMQSVQNAFDAVIPDKDTSTSNTESAQPVEPEASTEPPASTTPQSYFPVHTKSVVMAHFVDSAFAQEGTAEQVAPAETPREEQTTEQSIVVTPIDTPKEDSPSSISDSTSSIPLNVLHIEEATTAAIVSETASAISVDLNASLFATTTASSSEVDTASSSLSFSSTTESTSTAPEASVVINKNQFQNNFLEVLYTFDGITWSVLGDLNEISMKYRTFEIPIHASTSWSDLGQLQIKIQAKRHLDDTPTVYLDGITVEVLYETALNHAHPDFARDTILKDETKSNFRIVTLINNESKVEEIWYLRLKESEASSSVFSVSSTTPALSFATGTSEGATTSSSSEVANITKISQVVFRWKRLISETIPTTLDEILLAIAHQEALDESMDDTLPNFASDTIKRMKGLLSDKVLFQMERKFGDISRDELWVYDITHGSTERVGTSTGERPTTIAEDSPIGIKDENLFWLSRDKKVLYVYTVISKEIHELPVPPFDQSKGERGEVTFPQIPWKIFVGGNDFSFYSSSTGEVFSDENAEVAAKLRAIMKLDTVLDKDELSGLGLPVKAEDTSNFSQ